MEWCSPKQVVRILKNKVLITRILCILLVYIRIRIKTISIFHLHDPRKKSDLFIWGHITKSFDGSVAYNALPIDNKISHEIEMSYVQLNSRKWFLTFYLKGVFILWKNL